MVRKHPPFDREVVLTADLAVVVKRYVKAHDRRFIVCDDLKNHFNETFYSGILYLEAHSGVSTRSLSRILNCKSKHTTFNLADKIIQAMERPDLWGTELHVIKNPRLP